MPHPFVLFAVTLLPDSLKLQTEMQIMLKLPEKSPFQWFDYFQFPLIFIGFNLNCIHALAPYKSCWDVLEHILSSLAWRNISWQIRATAPRRKNYILIKSKKIKNKSSQMFVVYHGCHRKSEICIIKILQFFVDQFLYKANRKLKICSFAIKLRIVFHPILLNSSLQVMEPCF